MQIETQLVVNVTTQSLIVSSQQPNAIVTPRWYVGDIKPLRIQLVQSKPDALGKVSVLNAVGLAMDVTVTLTPGATVVASASAGAADSANWWTAELNLGQAAVTTALGTESERRFTLELKVMDGAKPQRFQVPILIAKAVSGETTPTLPEPPGRALEEQESDARYIPRVMPSGFFGTFVENGIVYSWQITSTGLTIGQIT